MRDKNKRWKLAQGYEQGWWKKKEEHIGTAYLNNRQIKLKRYMVRCRY
ncbi:MAG: hypothetical protein QM751_14395 [Paludibacteraceae bacterium]